MQKGRDQILAFFAPPWILMKLVVLEDLVGSSNVPKVPGPRDSAGGLRGGSKLEVQGFGQSTATQKARWIGTCGFRHHLP